MRWNIHKMVAPAVAAMTLAGGITLASAGTASAGGWGCSGTEVSDSPYPLGDGTTVYSYIHLYYDSSTGKNCAVNVKVGNLSGVKTWMDVSIDACTQTSPGDICDFDVNDPAASKSDSGFYSYYAGPVSVQAAGHCVEVSGATEGTDKFTATWSSGAFHCG